MMGISFYSLAFLFQTLPLSAATLCAASRAMALATVSGIRVPLGCGRILWGEGERGLAGGGASRVWP